MGTLAAFTLAVAVLAQCLFAGGHRLATRRDASGDAWLLLLALPSVAVTAACVVLVPSFFGLADPAACAGLTAAAAWILSAALSASLLAAAAFGLWTAGRAASRAPVGRPFVGELISLGAATGLVAVLAGGTSC